MLRVKDSQSLKYQRGAFTVLVFHTVVFLALIHSCRGTSEVIGPSQPIVATVGEDIILPCYLAPVMNAFDMTVEWARPDLDPRFVLVWRDGVELQSKKNPSFEGRTSLFIDELKLGNISLKLSKVKKSDEGRYRCFIPATSRASTVQLVVGAASSPVVQKNKTSSGVVLQCESEGWYPEPEVFWLDGVGNPLSVGPAETVRGPGDLYTVSSRVTVEKRHGNNFTCRVQQNNINQTRETHIHVPDHFFMVSSTAGTAGSSHIIIGSVIGCAALVCIPAVVLVVWKWRQKKFRNKKRSHEDGAEQPEEEKTVASKSDETGLQVMMEEEGESVPLMAGRQEEENNVDNRGEETMEPQSEHPQFVAERETHRDQLVTEPEPTRDTERERTSVKNEKVPLIPTEGETHQKQDEVGRQVNCDRDNGEEEPLTNPVKEDSGLPMVPVAGGQREQPQDLHTDREVQKEEETRQEPMTDVDKKEAKIKGKKENKQEQAGNGGSGSTRQKKQQETLRGGMQKEVERWRVENERKLQSEIQRSKEREKDKIELKLQKGNGNQHLSEVKNQNGSKTLQDVKRTTERTAENQREQMNEKLEETEKEKVENKPQSESEEKIKMDKQRLELKTQKGDGNQHVLDDRKQEAEHEDKKVKDLEGNQSHVTRMTERTAENQREQMNEKLEETEEKRYERENKAPSVSREVTERPELQTHQETAERRKQELQTEKQQEEETRQQPERSTKRVKVESKECKERQKEGLETDKGADEPQKKSKEIEKQRQLPAAQQPDVKEETREQPQEYFKGPAEREVGCQEVSQVEPTEIDRRPQTQRKVKRREKRQREQENELHEDQQQTVRKRKRQEEGRVQTEKTSKKPKECLEEQTEYPMEVEAAANMEQKVIDEPQGQDSRSQQDDSMDVDS